MVRCCGGLVATQWCRCLQYSWPLRLRTRINSPLELRSGRVMARWTRLLEAVAAVQLPGPTGASFTSKKKLACGAPRHSRNTSPATTAQRHQRAGWADIYPCYSLSDVGCLSYSGGRVLLDILCARRHERVPYGSRSRAAASRNGQISRYKYAVYAVRPFSCSSIHVPATVETVCAMRMRFWSCTHELIDLQILRFCWGLETCN
jgi:hypothetical protein